jgi:histidinol-phosphate aminotransferase
MSSAEQASCSSRRSFLQLSALAATAAVGLRIVTEPMLAAAEAHTFPKDAVVINANENPLGPCEAARAAVSGIAAQGGRYSMWLTEELVKTFASAEGLKPEYVRAFPGSSDPLHFSVLTFTSPTKSYVTADPGYEAGMMAAKHSGARVVKVPLTASYAHDVKAMIAAAPEAGLFYICNPNNPSGTLTSHADVEFALANKPKDAVVLVDEAYIHFSGAASAIDLVKGDKDVIVLRTFSKLYGMDCDAGLRLRGPSYWRRSEATAVGGRCQLPQWRRLRPACRIRELLRSGEALIPRCAKRRLHGWIRTDIRIFDRSPIAFC